MMKKFFCALLLAASFLLPLSGAEAVGGSQPARELWQKMLDNSKTLQNVECEATVRLDTVFEGEKFTLPMLFKMNIWPDPLQAKVFAGAVLPNGMLVNLDYYILETGGNMDVYFKGGLINKNNPPVWQKASVPIQSADKDLENEMRALAEQMQDKWVAVKLQNDGENDGTLNKLLITVKNRVIYDALKILYQKHPLLKDKSPAALETAYRDYLSKLGDFRYNVWVDKDGLIHKASFDFADNIKKAVKTLKRMQAKEERAGKRSDLWAFIPVLENASITCEFVYANHNAAPAFTLPEEAKNAKEIKMPAPPVNEPEPPAAEPAVEPAPAATADKPAAETPI